MRPGDRILFIQFRSKISSIILILLRIPLLKRYSLISTVKNKIDCLVYDKQNGKACTHGCMHIYLACKNFLAAVRGKATLPADSHQPLFSWNAKNTCHECGVKDSTVQLT